MKKFTIALFALVFILSPLATNAGFFDLFRFNQTAQISNVSNLNSSVVGYKKGDRADIIMQIQKVLNSKGLYKGDISGLIGPKTEASIRAWQQANRLSVTGILDAETINSILGRLEDGNRGGGNPNSTTAQANCAPGDMPWIQVVSPNGGETYVPGENIKVQWESCNLPVGSQVFIAFNAASLDLSGGYTMINSTPNDGMEQVTLEPASEFGTQQGDWYYGLHYKIGVGLANAGGYDYRDYSDNLFSIVDQLGEGNCDENQIMVSIAGDTPSGVQNINEFNVLKFTIENDSACDIYFEDLKVAYMTTDGKPYFDEIQIRDEQNNFLGENDELQTDPNFDLGDRIEISLYSPIQIDAGEYKDLTLRLMNYNQPVFDNSVPYNSYKHKYLMFGFLGENDFDFKWTTPGSPSFSGLLETYNNGWGNKVRIPLTSLNP